MNREEAISVLYMVEAHGLADEAKRMAIEALSREQKEEDLANDIARRMATIIENEQDMRVILKNDSTELLQDGTLKVNVQNGAEVSRVLVWGDDMFGGLYYADEETVFCPLADRACPFQGKEIAWCLTCPHISEEDRDLVKKAVAEPKTGECKDCTHWDKLNYEAPRQGWCDQFEDWTDADEFCSRCARMNGGEEE